MLNTVYLVEVKFLFLTTDSIKELHVEITTNCNARCPMCDRNVFGGRLAPGLKLNEWSKEDIDLVFSKDLKKLKRVFFCGTHGDPLSAQYLFEAIQAVKKLGAKTEIFTNGSLKTDNWWKDFTSILDTTDKIIFGVDGIETNHLYRQNTDIKKILSHMEIACKSKAKVRWDFLVFKHNEHEIETCRQKSLEMGFTEFRLRRTARFDATRRFPVMNNDFEVTHYLEPPTNPEYVHPSLNKMSKFFNQEVTDQDIIENAKYQSSLTGPKFYTYQNKLDYNINCLYREEKKIYVNSRLDVFPCCYISDQQEVFKNIPENELKYPSGELNLRNKSWEEILNHPYFTKDLIESWKSNNTPVKCIRTCGVVNREREQNISKEVMIDDDK